MATAPLIKGAWLQPGQHLDLIGAYRPDMREVDDEAMTRARVFVDARATTLHHIGELMAPIAAGAITEADVVADFYDLASGKFCRRSDDEITIARNGGGAHLDPMTMAADHGHVATALSALAHHSHTQNLQHLGLNLRGVHAGDAIHRLGLAR